MELVNRTEARDERYHIKVRRSGLVRFNMWLYDLDPSRLDTCKLFWGTVWSPIVMPIIALLFASIWVYDKVDNLLPRRSPKEYPLDELVTESEGPSAREQRLEKTVHFMSTLWFKASGVMGPVLAFLLPILGVLAVVAAIAFLVVAAILWTHEFLSILLTAVVIVLMVGVLALFWLLVFRLAEKTGKKLGRRRNRKLFRKLYHSVHNSTCAKIDILD